MDPLAVLLLVILLIVSFVAYMKHREVEDNKKPLRSRCVILPIGLGGSGKTTLARHLSGNPNADPTRRTEGFHIYESISQIRMSDTDAREYNVERYIVDYMGQQPSLLISQFARLSANDPQGPVRIGSINCVIFVIDLVSPPRTQGEIVPPRDFADQDRLELQLNEWSSNALDLIFGLFSKTNLKYVCIFLNKTDLLLQPEAKAEALHATQPLRDRLQLKQDANGFQLDVIVGSLDRGDGLNRLREMIDRHSTTVF